MTDQLSIPAGMPMLQRGSHHRPEDGSCLMEYTSLLADTFFSDHPDCTDPVLARLARLVNDRVGDGLRLELAVLAADLVGLRGRPAAVRAVVLEHVATAALALLDDPWLHGLRERASEHRDPATGWARRRWLAAGLGADTTFAFDRLAASLVRVDRARRERLLVDLLAAAVADVRALLGRDTGTETGTGTETAADLRDTSRTAGADDLLDTVVIPGPRRAVEV